MEEEETSTIDSEISTTGQSKQILLLGVSTFLTILATAMLYVNQPEFILNRFVGITELEYSFFDTTLYLSYLTVGILTGALSDRLGQRKLFIIAGTSGSALFYLLMTSTLDYPTLLVYRFFQGSFTVMAWQVFMTLVLDFSNTQNRGRNIGIFGTFLALAMGAGPVLGGVVAAVGVFMPYYTAAILNGIVLFLAIPALREPPVAKERPGISHSLAIIGRSPRLIIPGLFNLIDRLHMGFILTALPLFLSVVLGLSESLRGVALGVFALPFIVLQYPMGKLSDKYGRYGLLITGSIGFGVVLSLFGYLGYFGFTAILLLLVVIGALNGITAPPAMALVGDIASPDDSAMAMGFFNFMGNLGITVGPVFFGYMVLMNDFAIAFLAAGLLELLTLLVNIVMIKTVFNESILS